MMAPGLQRLIAATTCRQCNGNGRLGGCSSHKLPDGTTYRRDEGRACPTCKGSGIQPMAGED